jgi:uncharacterized membrane protein YuzA (DUF378 family)
MQSVLGGTMRTLNATAPSLMILGAVNWGVVGLTGIDLFARLAGTTFGTINAVNRVLYVVLGLAGLYSLVLYPWVTGDRWRRGHLVTHS